MEVSEISSAPYLGDPYTISSPTDLGYSIRLKLFSETPIYPPPRQHGYPG